MQALIRFTGHLFALSFGAAVFFLFDNIAKDVNEALIAYSVGLFCFVVSWSSGLFGVVRYTTILLLLAKLFLISAKYELETQAATLVFVIITHLFTSYLKTPSEWINTFKTLWIDWIILIPFFPIFSFLDLILHTDTFFPLLGYWLGATFYALGIVKLSELVWRSSFDTSKLKSQDLMTFVHNININRSTWNRIHVGELLICVWIVHLLFASWIHQHYFELERWHISFVIGSFSSLLLYLGPIAAGSALSLIELAALKDAVN